MTKRTTPAPAQDASGAENLPDQVAEVASTARASAKSEATLLEEIADLREKLKLSESKRSDAEKVALAAAEAQSTLMQRQIEEVPTGKFVKVRRARGYEPTGHYTNDGRDILKPIWKEVEVPTFFYKVDLPPVGGEGLSTNGIPMLHGVVYEVDIDTLRSMKERVYRCWDHDRNIHGSDENFYRRQSKPVLSARH